ncbi:hypothetical protein M0Q97_12685 [Candidatus Dojkabacteria bacterium]|jgi:hypothetical protein|nr:hypothetical protein [Candidatus Dojkabacteria bacterium]
MKTEKITLKSIKDSDGWVELAFALKFKNFNTENPDLTEDELTDKFYSEVINKKFKYVEYADIELVIDENFNIVGGRIL